MKKSLGNKRHELAPEHIQGLVRLYGECQQDATSEVTVEGQPELRVCSKILDNREFGFLKITVERPLRLNFAVSEERITQLGAQIAFENLATSKKRKDQQVAQAEIEEGKALQQQIIAAIKSMDGAARYQSRPPFLKELNKALAAAGLKLAAPVKKVVIAALSEQDAAAEICRDSKGNPEPDSNLRDTEIVPLPEDISLPLPLAYGKKASNAELLALVTAHCEAYLVAEVLPHVPDAWIDHSKTKVGYEIPLNRHFYVYEPPRSLAEIEDDIKALEKDIVQMLGEIV